MSTTRFKSKFVINEVYESQSYLIKRFKRSIDNVGFKFWLKKNFMQCCNKMLLNKYLRLNAMYHIIVFTNFEHITDFRYFWYISSVFRWIIFDKIFL